MVGNSETADRPSNLVFFLERASTKLAFDPPVFHTSTLRSTLTAMEQANTTFPLLELPDLCLERVFHFVTFEDIGRAAQVTRDT